MNRMHRVVWSESRKAFIVAGENAQAKGKPSSTRKAVASAVVMALAALASESAMAIAPPTCGALVGSIYTISASQTSNCYLDSGHSLVVTSNGSILNNSTAVRLRSGVITGGITNSGTISGGNSVGIGVYGSSTVSGGITNSGTIIGSSDGIYLATNSTVNGITNSATGTISGGNTGILIQLGSSVSGGITNSGTVFGGNAGITISRTGSVGGITNSGTISGAGYAGIMLGTTSHITGGITNQSRGVISGASGISLWSHATVDYINNSGNITGNSVVFGGVGAGIGIFSSSTVSGGITNSGTISGVTHAIYVDGTSTLSGLTITGNNTAKFIGDVYAPATPVTVASGATYTMDNGNLFTVSSFTNAGTLGVAAGGTGTITGNYTQLSTGTFQTYATSTSSYGKLVVNGTASLPSAANIYVYVNPNNTLAVGQILVGVIKATSLTSSNFYVTDNSTKFNFTAALDASIPNQIDLTVKQGLTAVGSANAADNTPGLGAAIVLDSLQNFCSTSPTSAICSVLTSFGNLSTTQAQSAAITQLLPLMTTGMQQFTFNTLHGVNQVVQARQGLSGGDDFITNRNAWVKPLGSWANQSDTSGVSGYKASTYGVVLGADGDLSQVSRLGAAFAISHSNVNNNLGSQSAGVDSYQAILYGSRSLDDKNTEFNWQGDYGTNLNKGNRYIQFLNQNAASSFTSNSLHLGVGIGRTLAINEATTFTPSVRADYTTVHSNGYTESGGANTSANLVVNGQTVSEFIVGVDGKVTHKLSDATTLVGNLGAGYDTMAKQSAITSAFVGGGAAFTTMGINPSPTIVTGGFGVVMKSSKAVEVTARYDVEARTGFTDQTVSLKARWPF